MGLQEEEPALSPERAEFYAQLDERNNTIVKVLGVQKILSHTPEELRALGLAPLDLKAALEELHEELGVSSFIDAPGVKPEDLQDE